jgi:hypothetical protein
VSGSPRRWTQNGCRSGLAPDDCAKSAISSDPGERAAIRFWYGHRTSGLVWTLRPLERFATCEDTFTYQNAEVLTKLPSKLVLLQSRCVLSNIETLIRQNDLRSVALIDTCHSAIANQYRIPTLGYTQSVQRITYTWFMSDDHVQEHACVACS